MAIFFHCNHFTKQNYTIYQSDIMSLSVRLIISLHSHTTSHIHDQKSSVCVFCIFKWKNGRFILINNFKWFYFFIHLQKTAWNCISNIFLSSFLITKTQSVYGHAAAGYMNKTLNQDRKLKIYKRVSFFSGMYRCDVLVSDGFALSLLMYVVLLSVVCFSVLDGYCFVTYCCIVLWVYDEIIYHVFSVLLQLQLLLGQ